MIDNDTGNIHLSNGFVITPALTLNEFQRSWFGRNAGINRPASTPKQCWFHESAGIAEGYSFSVGLSFQEQTLTRVSLVCETSMEDASDDEHDGAWVKRKQTHDALLLKDLGEPDTFTDTSNWDTPGLDKAPNYLQAWGKTVSEFDYGGGDAYVSITYYNGKAGDDKQ